MIKVPIRVECDERYCHSALSLDVPLRMRSLQWPGDGLFAMYAEYVADIMESQGWCFDPRVGFVCRACGTQAIMEKDKRDKEEKAAE